MGNSQKNRKSIKDEYLKLIEKKKREYFKKNESAIFACDIRVSNKQKWKDFVLEEIYNAMRTFPEAQWPKALEKGCREWKTGNDNKYRSNIVLFDYLQENKPASEKQSRVRKTIIKVPEFLESETINFEASSIFDFLNGHFDQSSHFIANMIMIFHQHFCAKYAEIFEISPQIGSVNLLSSELMKELKTFIMIVLQTMIYYYGGLLAKKMQENPNQMYDFIIEKILTKGVHDIMIHAYNLSTPEDFLFYKGKIQMFEGISCKALQINPLFCLDNMQDIAVNGYESAIEMVKEIPNVPTPMKKLEIISQTTDLICGSVDDYWRGADIDPSKLVIDGDQFLSIYIYIVIKSAVYDLKAHIWIITQLGRSGIQNGAMGYYLTTLEACMLQITSLSIGELDNLNDNNLDYFLVSEEK